MSYLRLNDEFALRKYLSDIPMVVRFGNSHNVLKISEEEMTFLKKCDGVTEINIDTLTSSEASYLNKCRKFGIISVIDTPCAIKAGRAFRKFFHKRIAFANWAITIRCNLNCLHCLNLTGTRTGAEPEMSFENAKIAIKKLADYGVEGIKLFGGEPTVYGHFMELVRLIQESGMELRNIDTNGLLINEEMLDEFEKISVRPNFSISFDGLGTHDWMRNRPGCEEKALKAIKLCLNRGYSVSVSININRKTLPGLYDTIRYLKGLGCKYFKLIRTSETFRWQESVAAMDVDYTIPAKEFAAMMPEVVNNLIGDIRDGISIALLNEIVISPHSVGNDIFARIPCEPEKCSGWCARAENAIFIGCNGHVVPCSGLEPLMQYNGLLTDEINIFEKDLDKILYGDFYRKYFRITRKDILDNTEECRNCDKWEKCWGGMCRVNSLLRPEIIALGIPIEKRYLAGKDNVYCYCIKDGYFDEIAKILDDNPK